ncbi:hypothetical protein BCS42_10745 [Crenothrix sp. D3]|nr:hypothetical protein BCS42_10745 [Crenothrix sp. D3]
MPSCIQENAELLDELKNLISGFRNSFIEFENTPIWEKETIIKFETAILNRDWVTFSKLWCFFENTSWSPNFLMNEMVKLLATLDFNRLCNAFYNVQDIVIFMLPMYELTDKQILILGVESNNPFVEFVAFYHVASNENQFNQEEESQIVTILTKVSKDTIRFQAWMDIFNKYPVRYPLLQTALGLFLADADLESMDSYINSISLNKSKLNDGGRVLVAKCLEAFSKKASLEKRVMLWTKAFNRWNEWNFETNENCLIEIAFSELDFALVGYFIECLSEEERIEYQQNILNKMVNISTQWHSSITNFYTRWHQLVSQFQPITHTLNIENKSWLMNSSYYIPNQFSNTSYLDMFLK